MRILVVGAGAIGSALAAELALAGRDVTLIARGKRLWDLAAQSLELERDGILTAVPVSVSGWDQLARTADVVFLCTKTGNLARALDCLVRWLAPSATVITLQNGVEAHQQAAARLPSAHIVAGRVHGFFEMDGGCVRHVGVPASILFGCTKGDAQIAHAAVMGALSESGFGAEVAQDIIKALWEKLLISACVGGVAAALDIPAGGILHHPTARAMLGKAMRELIALASAKGVALDGADVQRVMQLIAQFPVDATTSLQRDLSAHRPSEYDALVGAVLRMSRAHSVPHPAFLGIDRAIQERFDRPSG